MRKFLAKIVIFAILLILCDNLVGNAMDFVLNHIETGGQQRDNYICNHADEDILIFGSSRAVFHYNPQILEDSLGMTCFNCGECGCGIFNSYGRLLMIEKRHHPKVIIKEIDDLTKGDCKDLNWLRARYDRAGVSDMIEDIDPLEKYKMTCKMYRYNTKCLQNLFVYLTSYSTDAGIKGFRPKFEDFDTLKVKRENNRKNDGLLEIDSLKIKYTNMFINLAGNARLFFVASPIWYGRDPSELEPIKKICRQKNVPYIDFSNDPKYVHRNEYFADGIHMNSRGADEFTRDLVKYLH